LIVFVEGEGAFPGGFVDGVNEGVEEAFGFGCGSGLASAVAVGEFSKESEGFGVGGDDFGQAVVLG
jgi:hypothetical protein